MLIKALLALSLLCLTVADQGRIRALRSELVQAQKAGTAACEPDCAEPTYTNEENHSVVESHEIPFEHDLEELTSDYSDRDDSSQDFDHTHHLVTNHNDVHLPTYYDSTGKLLTDHDHTYRHAEDEEESRSQADSEEDISSHQEFHSSGHATGAYLHSHATGAYMRHAHSSYDSYHHPEAWAEDHHMMTPNTWGYDHHSTQTIHNLDENGHLTGTDHAHFVNGYLHAKESEHTLPHYVESFGDDGSSGSGSDITSDGSSVDVSSSSGSGSGSGSSASLLQTEDESESESEEATSEDSHSHHHHLHNFYDAHHHHHHHPEAFTDGHHMMTSTPLGHNHHDTQTIYKTDKHGHYIGHDHAHTINGYIHARESQHTLPDYVESLDGSSSSGSGSGSGSSASL